MGTKVRMDLLRPEDWDDLLDLIKRGKCTPFIGAGACAGVLPMGREIALKWATRHKYPLADSNELARVAQYLSIHKYEMYPKEHISDYLKVHSPDFSDLNEPHRVLADLNLPLYITTNYDDFMVQALQKRKVDPVMPDREFCRWNETQDILQIKKVVDSSYKLNLSRPLVYHLHGYKEIPQSLVLTESDYLDFLIRLQDSGDSLLPPAVTIALQTTSLLFVGYSLADWNFRVLFRGLISSMKSSIGYITIAVQLPPDDLTGRNLERALYYLNQYFEKIQRIKVRVYWGDVRKFSQALRERWEKL